jgi:hypothetical protein
MQRPLNAIQMQGNSDEEAEQDNIPGEEPPEPANLPKQHPVQEDRLMNISLAAYTGTPSDSSFYTSKEQKPWPWQTLAVQTHSWTTSL